MHNLVHILLRILAGIAGVLLLYVAFFLYEDEEARIQNRLEHIWRNIDALQARAMSKEAAFVKGAALATSAIFDRILGDKLVSPQSLSLAFNVSLASIFLTFGLMTALVSLLGSALALLLGLCLLVAAVLEVLSPSNSYRKAAIPPLPSSYREYAQLFILLIGAPFALVFFWMPGGAVRAILEALLIASVLCAGVITDTLFVIFFRWILRIVETASRAITIILSLAILVAATVVLIGPAIMLLSNGRGLLSSTHELLAMPLPHLLLPNKHELLATSWLGVSVLWWSLSNVIDVVCLLLLTIIIVALLLHRVVWPVLKRPLYAANRKGLIKNTKLLGALGTMLLLYAFPNNSVLKWLTDFLPKWKG